LARRAAAGTPAGCLPRASGHGIIVNVCKVTAKTKRIREKITMPVRSLSQIEIDEVRKVFQDGLDLTRVRILERSEFPNLIGQIGARLRGKEPPKANAITIRNTSYFPRSLHTDDPQHSDWLADMGWLMHELTHQWQYQHDGILYLFEAMLAPTYVYAPPGESPNTALQGFSKAGKKFRDFNREQQGDIVRDYYWSTKLDGANADRAGWDAYLKEVREPPEKKERPRA
jgi:hypothetical protein